MRGFVLVLFAAVPLFGGTVYTSATCDGVTSGGSGDTSFCSGNDGIGGASAGVLLADWYVYANAGSDLGAASSMSATASLSQYFILTVTGGSGDGYAEPQQLYAVGGHPSNGEGWASASLGGCAFGSSEDVEPPQYCPWWSVPFVFGAPQTLTLSESASASVGPLGTESAAAGFVGGFLFFNAQGQQLSGITYTFVPTDQPPSATPEPGTLPLLSAVACAAFIAFKLRRRSSDRRAARPAC
jgi:hypothetical protein